MQNQTVTTILGKALNEAASTPSGKPFQLKPRVKVSRAQRLASQRPGAQAQAEEFRSRVAAELTSALGRKTTVETRIADGFVHPFTQLSSRATFLILQLGSGQRVAVELDGTLAARLLELSAGSAEGVAPRTLTRIEEAALGYLVLASISAMRGAPSFMSYEPSLLGLASDRGEVLRLLSSIDKFVAVHCTINIDGVTGCARLLVPASAIIRGIESFPVAPAPTKLDPEVASASVPAMASYELIRLAYAEVAALRVGDVIVLPGLSRTAAALEGAITVSSAGIAFDGKLTSTGFTAERRRPLSLALEPSMTTDAPDITLDVFVELSRLRLTLGELSSLQKGEIIPLHLGPAQIVTIRVGDKPVARAELVEVEGEVGARILSLP